MTKKTKIMILCGLILCSVVYIIFAVWKYNRPLAEGFNEQQVRENSLKIIQAMSKQDFAQVNALSDSKFAEDFAKSREQVVKDYLNTTGEISDIRIQKITGYRDQQTKKDYAQVTALAKGDKKDLHYRLFLDREGKLVHMVLK